MPKGKNYNKLPRNFRIFARLNSIEEEILRKKMSAAGYTSRSGFLRSLILYKKIYHIDTVPLRQELNNIDVGLARIGNNINQIARRVNATQKIYSDDIVEIKNQLDSLNEVMGQVFKKLEQLGI